MVSASAMVSGVIRQTMTVTLWRLAWVTGERGAGPGGGCAGLIRVVGSHVGVAPAPTGRVRISLGRRVVEIRRGDRRRRAQPSPNTAPAFYGGAAQQIEGPGGWFAGQRHLPYLTALAVSC